MESVLHQTEKTRESANKIIGKKFGKLTVIKYAGIYKDKNSVVCRCECGNLRIGVINELVRGKLKSCGLCTRSGGKKNPSQVKEVRELAEQIMNEENTTSEPIINEGVETNQATEQFKEVPKYVAKMLGKRYGHLTVIGFAGYDDKKRPKVKCVCDCGTVCVKQATNVYSGNTTSCGCRCNNYKWRLKNKPNNEEPIIKEVVEKTPTEEKATKADIPERFANMIGKRYGRLKVVGYAGRDEHHKPFMNCVCECGTNCVKNAYDLNNGRIKSCGCLADEIRNKKKTLRNEQVGVKPTEEPKVKHTEVVVDTKDIAENDNVIPHDLMVSGIIPKEKPKKIKITTYELIYE